MSVNSFPGIGGGGHNYDCFVCHNEPATTGWDGTSVVPVLDGNATDSAYDLSGKNDMYIPVSENKDPYPFEFVHTQFGQNSTDLFMQFQFNDENADLLGTDTPFKGKADKIAILWNIDGTTTGHSVDPKMANMTKAGESIDLWMWSPSAAETQAAVPKGPAVSLDGVTYDGVYKDGADAVADTNNDVRGAASYQDPRHGSTKSLNIEIFRKLNTGEANDVQFTTTGWYEFSIAVWFDSAYSSHWVSFSHFVWVIAPGDTNYLAPGELPTAPVRDVAFVGGSYIENATEVTTVQNDKVVNATVTETKDNVIFEFVSNVTITAGVDNSETPISNYAIFMALSMTTFIAIYARRRKL